MDKTKTGRKNLVLYTCLYDSIKCQLLQSHIAEVVLKFTEWFSDVSDSRSTSEQFGARVVPDPECTKVLMWSLPSWCCGQPGMILETLCEDHEVLIQIL